MIDWAMAAPAIGVLVGSLALWLLLRRMHANLLRNRERAKVEREGHAPS
jgi:hypothetical protein